MAVKIRVVEIEATGDDVTGVFHQVAGLLGRSEQTVEPPQLPAPQAATPAASLKVARVPALRAEPARSKSLKPASTPAANGRGIDWEKYPIRTAQNDTLGRCVPCTEEIKKGERYRDGGYDGRRAHVLCVVQVDGQEQHA